MLWKKSELQFNANDVLTANSKTGDLYLGGVKLNQQEINNLNEEIKYFKTLRLSKIFFETVKDQARLTMFDRSQSFDDMRNGKAMLNTIGILENIFEKVENAIARHAKTVLK